MVVTGREPWSSGKWLRFTIWRSWVQIPAPDNCCKICLKRLQNKRKRGQVLPILIRWLLPNRTTWKQVLLPCLIHSLFLFDFCLLGIEEGPLFPHKKNDTKLLQLFLLQLTVAYLIYGKILMHIWSDWWD